MKKEFETIITWSTGEKFKAIIKVGNDGWGKVYDKADGLYCGNINPIKTMAMAKKTVNQ